MRYSIIVLSDEGNTKSEIKGERNMEEMAVFKSYLRRLMRDLKDLREALKNKDYEKAEKLIDDLIEDTQKDIED